MHYRIHTGEKPYEHKACGKAFGHCSQLIHHQVIHTEEQPYGRQEGGRTMSQDSTAIQHQRMPNREMQVNIVNIDKPSISTYPLLLIREFMLTSSHLNGSNGESPLASAGPSLLLPSWMKTWRMEHKCRCLHSELSLESDSSHWAKSCGYQLLRLYQRSKGILEKIVSNAFLIHLS